VCHGFDLTLTFGKYPKALQEMPRAVLFMGEWTESSDERSTENVAPMSKRPKKKLKLSVPKDKENQWQFVDNAKKAALSKFVPKYTATSTKPLMAFLGALRDICQK